MKNIFLILLHFFLALNTQARSKIEMWDFFEATYKGPSTGNPFMEVNLAAIFVHDTKAIEVKGFYDGDGIYKIRFMPTEIGDWVFTTKSNVKALDKQRGKVTCVPAIGANRGMVRVHNTFHFKYDDGSSYFPIGTTSYKWHHQHDTLVTTTLQTLKQGPFNKIRMCVLPFQWKGAMKGPLQFPYEGSPPKAWNFTRFNPEYFKRLDSSILELGNLGIQADLILFHSYDYTWGIDEVDEATQLRYLEYLIARVASFRNVWWSMGNEYDLIKSRNDYDWDRYFRYLQSIDPYEHLRSIHNGPRWYDHARPWITHLSIQHQNLEEVVDFREKYQKPVIIDECGYEGNFPFISGNLSPQELVQRFWHGYSRGCYVTHGESFMSDNEVSFWAEGGRFMGGTVPRLEILKKIVDLFPDSGINPPAKGYWKGRGGSFSEPDFYLFYLAYQQPAYIEVELPREHQYKVEIIDTWNMTITSYPDMVSGKCKIDLPGTTHLAVICRKADN